jgi:hypothetical protein
MNEIIDKNTEQKLRNSFNKLNKDDEFEIMFKNYSNNNRLNMKDFIHVIKVLTNYCKDNNLSITNNNSLDLSYSFDITSFDIYRLSINEQTEIEKLLIKYGNRRNHILFSGIIKEKLNGNKNIELIKKVRNKKLTFDLDEYDMRFRVSLEKNVNKTEASKLLELSSDERFNIKIRLKQRTSFVFYEDSSYKILVDCTISKTSQNLTNINEINENYEIELEVIRKKSNMKYNKIKEKLLEAMHFLLKNLYETEHIISNKQKKNVLEQYFKLVLNKKKLNSLYRMNPESLEIQHVVDKIVKQYSVSDKADGDACQAIIYKGKLYFLDNNCNITDSGIKNSKLSNYNDSIIDGELVYIPKYKKKIFLAFDILFYNNKDIRNLASLQDRFRYLDDLIKNIFSESFDFETQDSYSSVDESIEDNQENLQNYLLKMNKELGSLKEKTLVFRKYFIFTYGFSENEIFKYSVLLWDKYTTDLCPYDIDGIMFTPMQQIYTKRLDEVSHKIYKWKPPELNSIDFWVEFLKNKETGKIETIFDNTDNEEFKNRPYNIAHLHVGKKVGNYETPILFKPYDKLHICHMYLDNGFPRDQNGYVIQDNTVVEFYYKNSKSVNPNNRWAPIRTRFDKTEVVKRQKKKYGNNGQIASRIWRSIINEFNYNDMKRLTDDVEFESYRSKLKSKIDVKLISIERSQDIYYQKQTEISKPMRNFHNWIKTNIIYPYCASRNLRNVLQKYDILDIGMGRGADILKFFTSRVKSYVGIDPDYHGIYSSSTDGALSRLKTFKRKFPAFPPMTFIVANAGIPFTKDAQVSNVGKVSTENINALEKFFGNDKTKLNKQYDIATCMFALHYLFKDENTWNHFTDNLNKSLKQGAYFLCTLFDGDIVNKKFKDNKIESYYFDEGKQKKFFEIKKLYKGKDINKFGLKLDVHISSFMNANVYQTEYLVSKSFLINQLKEKCGLELVDTELFENIYNNHSHFFNEIPDVESNKDTKSYFMKVKEIYDLSDNLNKASFEMSRLNRYYIFHKKVTDLDELNKNTSKSEISKISLDAVEKTPGVKTNKSFSTQGVKTNKSFSTQGVKTNKSFSTQGVKTNKSFSTIKRKKK